MKNSPTTADWQSRLRDALAIKGWGTTILARRSGVTHSTVQHWLTGPKDKRPKDMSVQHALAISSALGYTVADLFDPQRPWPPAATMDSKELTQGRKDAKLWVAFPLASLRLCVSFSTFPTADGPPSV